MQPAEHDIMDWTSMRSWLNLPAELSIDMKYTRPFDIMDWRRQQRDQLRTSALLVYTHIIPMAVTSNKETRLQVYNCWNIAFVGERSNFKKFPTNTQDHGDA